MLPMLGPAVTDLTHVYAEKVKFIAFTFPAPHRTTTSAPYKAPAGASRRSQGAGGI